MFLLIFDLDVGRNYLISLISTKYILQCQLGDPLPGSSASIGAETILRTFRTWGIYSDASLENLHVFGYGVDPLRSTPYSLIIYGLWSTPYELPRIQKNMQSTHSTHNIYIASMTGYNPRQSHTTYLLPFRILASSPPPPKASIESLPS